MRQLLLDQLAGPPGPWLVLAFEGDEYARDAAQWLGQQGIELIEGSLPDFQLATEARYGIALLILPPAPSELPVGLLAALRDRHAARTLLLVGQGGQPDFRAALALGFRHVGEAKGRHLYCFDLFDYKQNPDWLNPRHWAHPGRWDKDRW